MTPGVASAMDEHRSAAAAIWLAYCATSRLTAGGSVRRGRPRCHDCRAPTRLSRSRVVVRRERCGRRRSRRACRAARQARRARAAWRRNDRILGTSGDRRERAVNVEQEQERTAGESLRDRRREWEARVSVTGSRRHGLCLRSHDLGRAAEDGTEPVEDGRVVQLATHAMHASLAVLRATSRAPCESPRRIHPR